MQQGGEAMSEPVETLEGWWVLHDLRRVDWERWRATDAITRRSVVRQTQELVGQWQELDRARAGGFALYRIAGHKADVLWLHLRPTLNDLVDLKATFDKGAWAPFMPAAYSYVSVVELSAYQARGNPDPETNPYLKSRLYPEVPPSPYVCFYPMSKRREGADNWYMMDRADRAHLMRGHGAVGHKYHDRVIQIISGSQGLDDWEWGVTLFAEDALDFKKLIYEMRFDEASARFADFGPFYLGSRLDAAGLGDWLDLEGTDRA